MPRYIHGLVRAKHADGPSLLGERQRAAIVRDQIYSPVSLTECSVARCTYNEGDNLYTKFYSTY